MNYRSSSKLKEISGDIQSDETPTAVELEIEAYKLDSSHVLLEGLPEVSLLKVDMTQCPRAERSNLFTLCEYLSTTKTVIRHVFLVTNGKFCPMDVGRIAVAVHDNPVIEHVFCSEDTKFPFDDFMTCIERTSQTRKSLTLRPIWQYKNLLESEKNELAEAISALPLLEDLSIYLDRSSYGPNERMLQLLHSHQCLRKLAITRFSSDEAQSDKFLVQLSNMLLSGMLESLELRDSVLNTQDTRKLLQGLQCCPTLSRVSLDCCFGAGAPDEFVKFLREEKEDAVPPIQEFRLYEQRGRYAYHELDTILTPPTSKRLSTIGASLQILQLNVDMEDIGSMVNALTLQGSQLLSLSVRTLLDRSWLQLLRGLPAIMHLRELSVRYIRIDDSSPSASAFLPALCQNGSLQKVRVAWKNYYPFFSDIELQQVKHFCDRNSRVCELLQMATSTVSDGIGPKDTDNQFVLCPSLLNVVKPVTRMAPGVVLGTLLALGEMVGLHGHRKRGAP
jgi:hypothetical protein